MYTPALRTSTLALSFLVSFGALAERGVLKADGIIRVKGADISTATVTVVPGNASAYVMPVGSKHVTLELPLDDVYLVSVEREGCPSKEVYFDTRVPVEMHAAQFAFPFMVSLEHLEPEHMFAYAAPVGFVRYVHGLKDFGYETQYVVRVEDELKKRMDGMRDTGVDPSEMTPVAQVRVIDRDRGLYSAPRGVHAEEGTGIVAPMVSEVPRLVHPVSQTTDREVSVPASDADHPGLLPLANTSVQEELAAPPHAPVATALIPASAEGMHGSPGAPEPQASVASTTGVEQNAHAHLTTRTFSRTEELITEPRSITRIIRFIQPTGHVEEYRKVTHAFGGVFYFQNSRSITERDFAQAIAE